jgi:hypothetical protein
MERKEKDGKIVEEDNSHEHFNGALGIITI